MVPIYSQCKNLAKKTFGNFSFKFSKIIIRSHIKASLVQESIKRQIISLTFEAYKSHFILSTLKQTRDKMKDEVSKLFDALNKKVIANACQSKTYSPLKLLLDMLRVKRSQARLIKSEIFKKNLLSAKTSYLGQQLTIANKIRQT